ncbi:MAG: DUF5063 domain-containing protein [Bacteroidales bacterium]
MDTKNIVYSRNVVEFVTVANEFCAFLENCERHNAKTFVAASSKILPLLYYKATLLPATEPVYDEGNEQFVSELDYRLTESKIEYLLGQHNDFLEIYDKRADENDGQYTASIAEYMADVYQDLKNFTVRYKVGNTDVMNDALWECSENFREYWGTRVVNLIRAFHILEYSNVDLNSIERTDQVSEKNTPAWLANHGQNEDINPVDM